MSKAARFYVPSCNFTLYITGNENAQGELTSVSAGEHVVLGKTPIGHARNYYPGLGDGQNKFSLTATSFGGYSLNMEQHASVSSFEQAGMSLMGYNIVNVAQKLDVRISPQGNVSVSAATDIFPSATLKVNGSTIMQYNQPSFNQNFTMPSVTPSLGTGGFIPRDPTYLPATWYKRL